MSNLSDAQRRAIQERRAVRVRENEQDIYDRLAEEAYDDGRWAPEEIDRLREEAVDQLDRYPDIQ